MILLVLDSGVDIDLICLFIDISFSINGFFFFSKLANIPMKLGWSFSQQVKVVCIVFNVKGISWSILVCDDTPQPSLSWTFVKVNTSLVKIKKNKLPIGREVGEGRLRGRGRERERVKGGTRRQEQNLKSGWAGPDILRGQNRPWCWKGQHSTDWVVCPLPPTVHHTIQFRRTKSV